VSTDIVGIAFTPSRSIILAISTSPATGALYRIDAGIQGRPIP
jgi:hypothetical protein